MSTSPAPLVNVQINGIWKQFPKGTRLIEACKESGAMVPHYCYHPKLSVPGNCRMCLVETGSPKLGPDRKPELGEDGYPLLLWSPRPSISCALEVSEGMGVRTHSPLVEECRKGVMEFLLINHPLDCPICDKAGECRLQEFSVEHGQATSRFKEEKVKKPKHVDLGKNIILDDERCILCSRCIRFMKEIAKEDVLGFVDRGGHSTLTVHPGRRLDNNYSLNTVDLCPVGALTSKDFRFKMRVWFMKETKTIDVNCGTGSNIIISSRENKIYRITPRQNDAVNDDWMPDSHRLNYHYLEREDRLKTPQKKVSNSLSEVSWKESLEEVAALLTKEDPSSLGLVASARMTNEELFLLKRLVQKLGIKHIEIPGRRQAGDGFLISTDGNPNTQGAKLIGLLQKEGENHLSEEFLALVREGKIKRILCFHENLVRLGLSQKDLAQLESLIIVDILPNESTSLATLLLPGAAAAEKRGTMVNVKNRLQRLNKAIEPPLKAHSDWEILRDLLATIESLESVNKGESHQNTSEESSLPQTFEELFLQMTQEIPLLTGITWGSITDLGKEISLS